jgi:hypothetical protein
MALAGNYFKLKCSNIKAFAAAPIPWHRRVFQPRFGCVLWPWIVRVFTKLERFKP